MANQIKDGDELSPLHAYKAMYEFLLQYGSRGHSDDIQMLLSNLALLEDGESADPAMLHDWRNAVEVIRRAESSPGGYQPIKFKLSK